MNLKKAEKTLKKLFLNKNINIDTKIEDDHVTLLTSVNVDGINQDIDIYLFTYNGGTLYMAFSLQCIKETEEALRAVNRYNQGSSLLKAIINDEDFDIVYQSWDVTDKNLAYQVERAMRLFSHDDSISALQPLIPLTYKKEK